MFSVDVMIMLKQKVDTCLTVFGETLEELRKEFEKLIAEKINENPNYEFYLSEEIKEY